MSLMVYTLFCSIIHLVYKLKLLFVSPTLKIVVIFIKHTKILCIIDLTSRGNHLIDVKLRKLFSLIHCYRVLGMVGRFTFDNITHTKH